MLPTPRASPTRRSRLESERPRKRIFHANSFLFFFLTLFHTPKLDLRLHDRLHPQLRAHKPRERSSRADTRDRRAHRGHPQVVDSSWSPSTPSSSEPSATQRATTTRAPSPSLQRHRPAPITRSKCMTPRTRAPSRSSWRAQTRVLWPCAGRSRTHELYGLRHGPAHRLCLSLPLSPELTRSRPTLADGQREGLLHWQPPSRNVRADAPPPRRRLHV